VRLALSQAAQNQFKWQTAKFKWFFSFNLPFEIVLPQRGGEGLQRSKGYHI
jgi:hypothetical protein